MDVDDYFLRNSLWPAVVYTVLMMILGLLGNTLVLVLYRNDFYKSMKWVFIYFLAILDILSCLISMPADLTILFHVTSFPSWSWCKISRYLSYVFHGSSCVILMIIAFNRYRTICKGSVNGLNRTIAKRICLGVIIFAVIVDSPSLLLYGELFVPIAIQNNSARIISKVEYIRILVQKNETDLKTNSTSPGGNLPELYVGKMCGISSEYMGSMLTQAFILFQFIMFVVLVMFVTFFYFKIICKLMGYRDQQEQRFSVHFPKKSSIGLEETSTSHVSIQDTFNALQPEPEAGKGVKKEVHSSQEDLSESKTHSSQEDLSESKMQFDNGTSHTSPEEKTDSYSKNGNVDNTQTTTGDEARIEKKQSQSDGCRDNSDSDGEDLGTTKSRTNGHCKQSRLVTQSSVTFNVTEKNVEICPQPPKKPIRLNSISSMHSSTESLPTSPTSPTSPTFRGRLSSMLGSMNRRPRRRLSVKPIQSLRSSVMLLSISLAFILSFLPFWIIVIWRAIVGSSFVTSLNSTTYGLVTLFARSALVSNAINPILYAFLNSQFRKRCKSICKKRYY